MNAQGTVGQEKYFGDSVAQLDLEHCEPSVCRGRVVRSYATTGTSKSWHTMTVLVRYEI